MAYPGPLVTVAYTSPSFAGRLTCAAAPRSADEKKPKRSTATGPR
ncbi:MAG: hypothetical protein ACYC3Q_05230 [Gemmatimonadaceae bacterium]